VVDSGKFLTTRVEELPSSAGTRALPSFIGAGAKKFAAKRIDI
jgi:hypothetical protein